jgi:hypothetical protein
MDGQPARATGDKDYQPELCQTPVVMTVGLLLLMQDGTMHDLIFSL